MSDTRIDNSTPKTSYSGCDEESGVCGAVPKPEPQVSKPDPLVSNVDESWYPPMLPETKPSHLAQVAKNMSAPPPPPPATDADLRATYSKMTDAELEKEVKTLGKRLSDGGQYSGADTDTNKFHAAESVAKSRADAARPTPKEPEEGWRVPVAEDGLGLGGHTALKTDGSVRYGEFSAQLGVGHTGIQATARHEHTEWHLGHGVELTAEDNVATAGYDAGIHNNDGSWGVHGGGGAALASWEGTLSKRDVGSFTLGVTAGESTQISIGGNKEGAICAKVDIAILTVGMCIGKI